MRLTSLMSKKLNNEYNNEYIIVLIILLLWNALIFVTPLLASMKNPFASYLYLFFSYTCHQDPARSLFIFGYQLPVCARDVAIYIGMLVGLILLPFIWGAKNTTIPSLWIYIAAMAPLVIDGVTQLLMLRESTNTIRIFTGAIIGVVMPFYLVPIINLLRSSAKDHKNH